jgi:hypothetical protein
VLAALSAAVSAHWLAGGTWLLSTVGGAVEAQGRQGAAVVTVGLAPVVVLELVVAGLALALAHPPAVRALVLTGVLGEPADPTALRRHVLLRDPWCLLWGLLLVVAALSRRRLSCGSPSG